MKIFTKLFFSILLILTVTLSAVHYIAVTDSFDSSLQTEITSALRQHRLVKYAVAADVQTASVLSQLDEDELEQIVSLARKNFATEISLEKTEGERNDDVQYEVINSGDQYHIHVESMLVTKKGSYMIGTRGDVTKLYNESREMSVRYRNIYLVAEILGAVLAAVIAVSVTRPIRKLTRASKEMAAGNYELKIPIKRKDEVGELAGSFNKMKDSIVDTMDQIELEAKRKEDFVGNFAHELKTPMTSIIGYADQIYSGDLSKEEMREASGYILNEGLRLESLSFKLMELITIEDNRFVLEDTSTYDFFEDVQQTIMPAAEKKGVKIAFACEQVFIKVEYDLFKTMVMNLIDNAFKSGGDKVDVKGITTSDGYQISITDNGRGIPEEELGRITEAFYMIDKARSRKEHGAGLGLALCERVARLHDTTLKFESEVGKGTTVSFVMKISEEYKEDE